MGKLTEAEKAANKDALKAKRQAHTARRKLLEAREAELTAEKVTPLQQEADQARAATEAAWMAVQEYDRACAAEVAALQKKHEEGRVPLTEKSSALRLAESEAWGRRNQAQDAVRKQIEVEFPDLKGHARYSAAGWTPPTQGDTDGS